MRAAVVGHLEWVQFVRVPAVPLSGDIVHALEWWDEPAGGGPAAAVQLHKLGAQTSFFTALGDDELGRRALADLERRGLDVHAVFRNEPTRRAVCFVDGAGERTITVMGERLAPRRTDELDWDLLSTIDALYFTAGDAAALRESRRARVLTATARALEVLRQERIELDALVGSLVDPGEKFSPDELHKPPRLSIWTDGERGGKYAIDKGAGAYPPFPVSADEVVDRYGAGDAFAAALTFALGAGMTTSEALQLAARAGAAAVRGRGPYEGQLLLSDL
ncbi:MAG: PfkB family carbohydrate kinase [Actinomycetota bacterium]|nr:PfkB family carbohydrate kinase [Actinomycetota bacterium]